MSNGESTVSNSTISQRAEALEKAEKEAAEKATPEAEAKAKADKEAADKVAADKAAADKAEADKKATEEASKEGKEKDPATGKFVSKKAPNDPDELRKWNTRVSQENKKLRDEMASLKEAQEKTFKLLSSISKQPIDYKELAKDPEKLQRVIEEERENATAELKGQLDHVAAEAKQKDTVIERMRREHDSENYPEWKRLFPTIAKLAAGPMGQGDPRVDYTKPAGDVLDQLYELAMQEAPKPAEPAKPAVPAEKTYTETEMKALMADMLAKEKEAISKTAKDEAVKEAQEALRHEAAGTTVASAGKGAGRVPSDQLAAFKKMSLTEQREWLIAQSENK